eukprot:306409-Pyramimonas_sp.AAC.1
MVHAPASRPLVTNRVRTRGVSPSSSQRRCAPLPAGLQTRRRTCERAAVTPRPGVTKSLHGQLVQFTVCDVAQAAARTPEKKSCQHTSSLPA